MFNLIRMNLYRMAKTKSVWMVLLCMAMFCVFSCSMEKIDLEEMQKKVDTSTGLIGVYTGEDNLEMEGSFGIAVKVPDKENGEIPTFLEFYNSDVASGIILVFLTIGCVMYFIGEIKSGFLKNIAGQTKHKPDIFLSKIFVNIVYVLVSLVIYGVVQFFSLWFLLKDQYVFRFGAEHLKETGVLLLVMCVLFLAFLGGMSMLTTVLKSTAVGITMGMFAAFGVLGSFVSYVEKMLDVELQKYLVMTNVHQMLPGVSGEDVLLALIVGVLFSLVYYGIGAVYFTKKDVV